MTLDKSPHLSDPSLSFLICHPRSVTDLKLRNREVGGALQKRQAVLLTARIPSFPPAWTPGAVSLPSPVPLPRDASPPCPVPRTWQLQSWGRFFTRIFLRLLSSRCIRCSRAATSSGCSAAGAGPRTTSHVLAEEPGPRGPHPAPGAGPAAPPRPAPPSRPPLPAAAIFPAPRGCGLLGRFEGERRQSAGGGPGGGEAGGGRRVGPARTARGRGRRRRRSQQPAGGERKPERRGGAEHPLAGTPRAPAVPSLLALPLLGARAPPPGHLCRRRRAWGLPLPPPRRASANARAGILSVRPLAGGFLGDPKPQAPVPARPPYGTPQVPPGCPRMSHARAARRLHTRIKLPKPKEAVLGFQTVTPCSAYLAKKFEFTVKNKT